MIVGIFAYVFATDIEYEFDVNLYDNKIEQFLQNEAIAIVVFDKIGYSLSEQTDEYGFEIERVDMKIDDILTQLN